MIHPYIIGWWCGVRYIKIKTFKPTTYSAMLTIRVQVVTRTATSPNVSTSKTYTMHSSRGDSCARIFHLCFKIDYISSMPLCTVYFNSNIFHSHHLHHESTTHLRLSNCRVVISGRFSTVIPESTFAWVCRYLGFSGIFFSILTLIIYPLQCQQ